MSAIRFSGSPEEFFAVLSMPVDISSNYPQQLWREKVVEGEEKVVEGEEKVATGEEKVAKGEGCEGRRLRWEKVSMGEGWKK